MAPQPHFLTAEHAAIALDFRKADGSANTLAFYQWVRRHQVRTYRRGRRLLFRLCDLEAALTAPAEVVVEELTLVRGGRGKR